MSIPTLETLDSMRRYAERFSEKQITSVYSVFKNKGITHTHWGKITEAFSGFISSVRQLCPSRMEIQKENASNLLVILCEQYKSLTVCDFGVCLKNGISGKYGRSNAKIDYQLISEWLEQYSEERTTLLRSIEADKKLKDATSGEFDPEMLSEIQKQLNDIEVPETDYRGIGSLLREKFDQLSGGV